MSPPTPRPPRWWAAPTGRSARLPASYLAAALDDVCCVEERPNVPGTVDQYPNWRLALPLTLEQIEGSAVAATVARSLQRDTEAGRSQPET